MLLTSPAGNDLPFDESSASKVATSQQDLERVPLVQGWEVDEPRPNLKRRPRPWRGWKPAASRPWKNSTGVCELPLSEALMTTYRLVWEEYCSWYLESIKPPFGEPIDGATKRATLEMFERMLKLLHPFMPFLTEEVWHWTTSATDTLTICVALGQERAAYDKGILADIDMAKEVVTAIRNIRNDNGIPNKEKLELKVQPGDGTRPPRAMDCAPHQPEQH